MTEKISTHNENDYSPVNKFIDEQNRLRRAKSFWINAKSWSLLLIAIGLLALLLAWAYAAIKKHYVVEEISKVQENIIKQKTEEVISSSKFKKNAENLSKLNNAADAIAESEKTKQELSKIKAELNDLQNDREKQIKNDNQFKEELEKKYGSKIAQLESEKLDRTNEIIDLKKKLLNNPADSALVNKIKELQVKNSSIQGNLRYFMNQSVQINGKARQVKTRVHFNDPREKPNKIECYINFNDTSLADLELGTEKSDFFVPAIYLDKGFTKNDFINVKKNNCSWKF